MPPLPGEERMLTVFADIHYYFTAPKPRPLHHRFDKSSYLYVYNDASQHRVRIEIANNPGTPEQDAFDGVLDHVHLRHSTKFPTLCTLTVDGTANSPEQTPSRSPSTHEWRLPSADPRDEGKFLYRLHTLDIYFWTLDDANQFLNSLEHVLSQAQIETDRHPSSAPEGAMSTVVQQLENVAIMDPAYQNGQTRNSRSESASVPQTTSQPASGSRNLAASGWPSGLNQQTAPEHPKEQSDAANYAPLAYNPVAPAAPEPIKHREKTPPPVDATGGTGLAAAAAAADHGHPYASPPLSAGFAPPPSSHSLSYSVPGVTQTGYGSPPPSAGLGHAASLSSHSSFQTPSRTPSFPGPPVPSSSVAQPGSMAFAPPSQEPNAHLYGQHAYASQSHHPHQPHYADYLQNQPVSPPPIGGYSNYAYDQPRQHQRDGSEYDIHSQVYRPTEAEANTHYYKHALKAQKNPGQRPHKLEEKAARVETSVNRFLKKLEKKL